MNAYQSKAAPISVQDADVDDVIASLSHVLAPCDDDQDEDEYPTWVDIEFPREVHMLHGVASLSIPVRLILTWIASHAEDQRFLAIRDDFYDEEHDDDFMMCDQFQLYDPEELARLRIDRRNKKAKREAERMCMPPSEVIELEPPSPEERWGSCIAEGLAMEAENSELGRKSAELDRKWEAFVELAHTGSMSLNWIDVKRSELKLEGCQLDLQFDTLMARMQDLESSVMNDETSPAD